MEIDSLFTALADPTRRQILIELSSRDGQTLYELCAKLLMVHKIAMSRQAISKHLDALEQSKLICTTWNGREKLHYLNRGPLGKIRDWVNALAKPGQKKRPLTCNL
jgi:DNA-binding transcriptional ArsR family regulator